MMLVLGGGMLFFLAGVRLWMFAAVFEAGLSFLGAGTPPPTPSWGSMLNEARQFMVSAPLTAVFPGLAISLAVLGFNLFGDGMRDVLDPRLRG
jgi:peptide/nickel transport system permease protein